MLDWYSKAVLTVIAIALSAIAIGLLGIVYVTPPPPPAPATARGTGTVPDGAVEWAPGILYFPGVIYREGPNGVRVSFPAGTDAATVDRVMQAVAEFYVPPPPPGFVLDAPGTPDPNRPWEADPIVTAPPGFTLRQPAAP